jgi:hypothetical protein
MQGVSRGAENNKKHRNEAEDKQADGEWGPTGAKVVWVRVWLGEVRATACSRDGFPAQGLEQ